MRDVNVAKVRASVPTMDSTPRPTSPTTPPTAAAAGPAPSHPGARYLSSLLPLGKSVLEDDRPSRVYNRGSSYPTPTASAFEHSVS